MADVKGIMMGGAGHDAAVIVAAMIQAQPEGGHQTSDEVLAAYEYWRDAILASNEKAQAKAADAEVPEDPGAVRMTIGAAKGLTIREVFESTEKIGFGSGPEYLTWVVSTGKWPDLAAAIRKFFELENERQQ